MTCVGSERRRQVGRMGLAVMVVALVVLATTRNWNKADGPVASGEGKGAQEFVYKSMKVSGLSSEVREMDDMEEREDERIDGEKKQMLSEGRSPVYQACAWHLKSQCKKGEFDIASGAKVFGADGTEKKILTKKDLIGTDCETAGARIQLVPWKKETMVVVLDDNSVGTVNAAKCEVTGLYRAATEEGAPNPKLSGVMRPMDVRTDVCSVQGGGCGCRRFGLINVCWHCCLGFACNGGRCHHVFGSNIPIDGHCVRNSQCRHRPRTSCCWTNLAWHAKAGYCAWRSRKNGKNRCARSRLRRGVCIQDYGGRVLRDKKIYGLAKNSPADCKSLCRGYRFAAVEYSNECFCGNELYPQDNQRVQIIDSSKCNMACKGSANEKCGGSWAMNLYRV